MSPLGKEKLRVVVGALIALALVLSVAQNIHYFVKYNSSIATLLIFVGKNNTPASQQIRAQLEKALLKEASNKKDSSSAGGVIEDLIKEAQKHGISKHVLLLEIKGRLE